MAAVVRVKRCLDEEPSSGLILSCKRKKTATNNEDAVETIFKFAGTVENQEESVALLTPNKLLKADVKTSSRPILNVSQKVRNQVKSSSESNRYKLVNYFRAIGNVDLNCSDTSENQNSITVLDVEDLSNDKENAKPPKDLNAQSASAQYVYDLYYTESDAKDIDVDDLMLDGLVSIAPVESELVFDSYRNHRADGDDSDSPLMDDDDDSNDENNWRNDYPDEDEGENSDEDDDVTINFRRVTLGDHELSSDDDDERLPYSEDLSPTDVRMYGLKYASFKKKALREMNSDIETTSDSDEESNTSKSVCSSNNESHEDCE